MKKRERKVEKIIFTHSVVATREKKIKWCKKELFLIVTMIDKIQLTFLPFIIIVHQSFLYPSINNRHNSFREKIVSLIIVSFFCFLIVERYIFFKNFFATSVSMRDWKIIFFREKRFSSYLPSSTNVH